MLNKYIMFSISKIIVWMIVISILTKIIVIMIFPKIEQPCVRACAYFRKVYIWLMCVFRTHPLITSYNACYLFRIETFFGWKIRRLALLFYLFSEYSKVTLGVRVPPLRTTVLEQTWLSSTSHEGIYTNPSMTLDFINIHPLHFLAPSCCRL